MASGFYSVPLERLAASVAASTAFQDWVGADDEEEAANSVYIPDAEGDAELPLATIECDHHGREQRGEGPESWFDSDTATALSLIFRAAVGSGSAREEYLGFLDQVGAVMAELEALSGTDDDYAEIESHEVVAGPARDRAPETKSAGEFYEIEIQVRLARRGAPEPDEEEP